MTHGPTDQIARRASCRCGADGVRSEEYDSYYCPVSRVWLEEQCALGATCPFCSRPEIAPEVEHRPLRQSESCCYQCAAIDTRASLMIVCPVCANKRCPKATDHRHACTDSNEIGQAGSRYKC